MVMDAKFMRAAIEEAEAGMRGNEGGPFGAVLVHSGEIVARAHNEVVGSHDPTAHAEILAIRRGSKTLGRFDLSDCTLVTTCEPCPMCLAAILWARIRTVYFGCSRRDAAAIGFADNDIYEHFRTGSGSQPLQSIPMQREECLKLFAEWEHKDDKTPY